MSQGIRKDQLYAAEDFVKNYRSYKDVDFRAYDFDTLKTAYVEYLREFYPEDFNDYIESSEFIAIIELIAYLGTSLSYRVDLNARENFLETAQRDDSVIKLSRMLNYYAKRNTPVNGLFKIVAVQTTESTFDSLGEDLANQVIYWNDENNANSYEQFIRVMNNIFTSTNPFGKPFKSNIRNGIQTDLYQIEIIPNQNVVFPASITVNGISTPFDIVNVNFDDSVIFYERMPNISNPFHLIYRNSGLGQDSIDTGFFLYFRQGELLKQDFSFDSPIKDRVVLLNQEGINEDDIYVQEIGSDGSVLVEWTKVEYGNNIYNDIDSSIRTIYSVVPSTDNRVKLIFPDGEFGEIPTGIFRVWYRRSLNEKITLTPDDVLIQSTTIQYVSKNNDVHRARFLFQLDYPISNGEVSESIEDIRNRAPHVYYTQDRMVNNEDYTVYPLAQGNSISKIKSINRTYSGHSRYYDINDPTGFHQNITVNGNDGLLYKDNEPMTFELELYDNESNIDNLVDVDLFNFLADNQRLTQFYYDEYLQQYLLFEDSDINITQDLYWITRPVEAYSNKGFIASLDEDGKVDRVYNINQISSFFRTGSTLVFDNQIIESEYLEINTVNIKSIFNNGDVSDIKNTLISGPIELDKKVGNKWKLQNVYPGIRLYLNYTEREEMKTLLKDNFKSSKNFGLHYDLKNDKWSMSINEIDLNSNFNLALPDEEVFTYDIENNWLVSIDVLFGGTNRSSLYTFTSRGSRYIFESYSEMRFYYEPDMKMIDSETGLEKQDSIIIKLNEPVQILDNETWIYSEITLDDNSSEHGHVKRRWSLIESDQHVVRDISEGIPLQNRNAVIKISANNSSLEKALNKSIKFGLLDISENKVKYNSIDYFKEWSIDFDNSPSGNTITPPSDWSSYVDSIGFRILPFVNINESSESTAFEIYRNSTAEGWRDLFNIVYSIPTFGIDRNDDIRKIVNENQPDDIRFVLDISLSVISEDLADGSNNLLFGVWLTSENTDISPQHDDLTSEFVLSNGYYTMSKIITTVSGDDISRLFNYKLFFEFPAIAVEKTGLEDDKLIQIEKICIKKEVENDGLWTTESYPIYTKFTSDEYPLDFDVLHHWSSLNEEDSISSDNNDSFKITYYNTFNEDIDATSITGNKNFYYPEYGFNIHNIFIYEDGYRDPRKVEVKPIDSDNDGISDYPFSVNELVDVNDIVFFEKFIDDNGYSYTRPWESKWLDLRKEVLLDGTGNINNSVLVSPITFNSNDLILIFESQFSDFEIVLSQINDLINSTEYSINNFNDLHNTVVFVQSLNQSGNVDFTSSKFYLIDVEITSGLFTILSLKEDNGIYSIRNGISYTLDENKNRKDLQFTWNHLSTSDVRIDPAISNIIDMIILPTSYLDDVNLWKKQRQLSLENLSFPTSPTAEELRIAFSSLNENKMISDQIIFQPATFKILFGDQAPVEYQATFKAVKSSNSTITDAELRSSVIQAIEKFFDINNWDFGETFYYTELSSFIHNELSQNLRSIVIVPKKEESQFGNLFEIPSESNQLFLSTATVSDIQIVDNLTETNMRM